MTERGFYPKAINKNIPPGSNDPAIKPRLAILHVSAGTGDSLHDYFNGPSGGVESHFYIRFDGTVEQYRSIYIQADANLDANDFAVSIETEGLGNGTWTDAQLEAIRRLLIWLHLTAGIPLRKCEKWDGSGIGYHTMFGAPGHWTPVAKTCPGPERIKQFPGIIAKLQPAPSTGLRFTSANMDFVRGHDTAYLAHLCATSDVLLLQECKNVDLSKALPDGWTALQDMTSPATMGSAICYRNETVEAKPLRLHLGANPIWGRFHIKMLVRHIATAHLRDKSGDFYYAVAAHMPPLRFKFLQPGMTKRLRKVIAGHHYAVIGTDANQPLAKLAAALGLGESFGKGIVGLIVGDGLNLNFAGLDPFGVEHNYTDHPAITAVAKRG